MEMIDARWMQLALQLAARGRTSPNPRVGAVVVREGELLATGYHRAVGQPHAEVQALSLLDFHAPGATLYVNLEPCAHFGRTPPCVDAILRSGIRKVKAGMMDPNPLVKGRGFQALRDAGVEVEEGILLAECQKLNEGFTKAITTGLPWVTLKLAATADGRTATRTGESRWITSPEARRQVHRLRSASDAVLVGIGTVLKDDPELTARFPGRARAAQPLRVVLDSRLRVPLEARVLEPDARTLLLTTSHAAPEKIDALRQRGVDVEIVPEVEGRIDLREALRVLTRRGIVYVLAEPGAELAASLVTEGVVDRYWFFFAPKLFAGLEAPGMLAGPGITRIDDAVALRWGQVRRVGPDLLVEAFPVDPGGSGEEAR